MQIFFILLVPIIFFLIAFFVKLIIEACFQEDQLYLGIELALGNLSSTITYMYSKINDSIKAYQGQANVPYSEFIQILQSLAAPLIFLVVTVFCLLGIICIHRFLPLGLILLLNV